MPELNGHDLAIRLRDLRPGIGVLFMSGYTANVIIHRGVLDERVFLLQKPFTRKELAVKIREVLAAAIRGAAGDGGVAGSLHRSGCSLP